MAQKLAAKSNYVRWTIFDENIIAFHMKKTKIYFHKPVYLGMCILYLSKSLRYDYHYNYIKIKYEVNAQLLFTDTDSLAYEIKIEDFTTITIPTLRNGLTLVTTKVIIHLELK